MGRIIMRKRNSLYVMIFISIFFSFVSCKNPFFQDFFYDTENNSNLPITIDEFSIGDVLFSDGTCMKVEDVKLGVPDDKMAKAMAVIAFIAEDGRAVGVGLNKKSSANWTKSGSFGETYKFKNLIVQDHRHGDKIDFEGDLDGSDNWAYICEFDPEGSADARSNYPAFYYANTYGETYNLGGTEFEKGWYLPAVNEMYTIAYTNRNIVQDSLSAVGGFYFDTGYYSTSSEFYRNPEGIWAVGIDREPIGIFAKHCPSAGAVFVRVFDKNSFTKYKNSSSFPTITEILVPTAGEGYTGELPVTIIGKNLKGNKFKSSDATFGKVTCLSDSKAIATITCSGIVGYEILTVSCGNSSAKCSVEVVSSRNCFSVGDVLFTDGSRVKVTDIQCKISDKGSGKAFGVVSSAPYGGGTAKVIGLKKSAEDEELFWAKYKSVSYEASIPEIRSDYNGLKTTSYTFYGDLDGSDNWNYIRRVDPEGAADASTNYPAFDFANNYGKTAGLSGTDYEKGWYIPSIKELYDVFCNREVVQMSLTAAGGFDLLPENRKYESFYYYWSSSTLSSSINNVSCVNFVDNENTTNIYSSGKSSTFVHVLVMQSVKAK